MNPSKPTIADCEAGLPGCLGNNTETWRMNGIVLCKSCYSKELQVTQETSRAAMHQFRQQTQETPVILSTDLHNAATIPIVTLRATILANPDVPEDKKEQTFLQGLRDLITTIDAALFEHDLEDKRRADIKAKMLMERKAAITNGQEAAGRVSAEVSAQYRIFDVNYKPPVVKQVRQKPVPSTKPEIKGVSLVKRIIALCKENGIPEKHKNVILMRCNRGMTPEQAVADILASL